MSNEYKLVPRVANLEMKAAGQEELERQDIPPAEMQTLWFAMSNAAPQPPALGCVHLPSIQEDGIEGVGYNKGLRDAAAAIEAAGYPISNDPRSKVVGV